MPRANTHPVGLLQRAWLAALALLAAACAHKSPLVALQPSTVIPDRARFAAPVDLALRVLDERPVPHFGYLLPGATNQLPFALRSHAAEVLRAFETPVQAALRGAGFRLVPIDRGVPLLQLEIRAINYDAAPSRSLPPIFLQRRIEVLAAANVAIESESCTYRRLHRAFEDEQYPSLLLFATEAARINRVLSQLLQAIVSDAELFACLARLGPASPR